MEYNISEAELPTMVVRYENKLILRSVITGQHLQDLGFAPVWDEVLIPPALEVRRQRIEAAHDAALEALVRLYPCEELMAPQIPPPQSIVPQNLARQMPPMKPPTQPMQPAAAVAAAAAQPSSPITVNEAELPPCKVHRNYCCNYCSFCTQNPRSHLLHQRQIHGIRLSIHCCHHCQYASRYFQKLKRHVKMVHMGNSPGRTKLRNKTAARRAVKPRLAQAKAAEIKQLKGESILTPSTTAHRPPLPPLEQSVQVPAHSLTNQSPLPPAPSSSTAGHIIQPAMPPAVFTNPEAFFEAAYRNQLIQQQLQMQRFKEIVKFSNQMNKAAQPEAVERSTSQTTPQPPASTMTLAEKVQALQIMKAASKPASLVTSTPNPAPTTPTTHLHPISHPNSYNPELEKKRLYGCRKCSYVTHIKSRYNKHVKYHSMPMIQCDKCEFRTTYKWNLTRHLRSHHGNGLYKCSVCSFSAHMKQSLTSHELNHHSPPVGHVTHTHSKPHRRRRCRVGGSDLVHDVRANAAQSLSKTTPITTDHQQQHPPHLSSSMAHEGLKLVIKREAGTSSYSSSQTSRSLLANEADSWKIDHPSNSGNGSKTPSSPSDCYTSSYSASPSSTCSNVSVVDHEAPTNDVMVKFEAEDDYQLQETATFNDSPANFLNSKPSMKIEPPCIPCPTPQTLQQLINLPPAKPIYTSSIDSDPDSEDSETDEDSDSTVSANETVPHGLHIAYDSSSPERKSSLSDTETFSEHSTKFQSNHEVGLQENMTTL